MSLLKIFVPSQSHFSYLTQDKINVTVTSIRQDNSEKIPFNRKDVFALFILQSLLIFMTSILKYFQRIRFH